MEITTPIPGLDNFMRVETDNGMMNVMFEQSSKFKSLSRPGASVKAVSAALNLDFVVRAESPEGAVELLESIWG